MHNVGLHYLKNNPIILLNLSTQYKISNSDLYLMTARSFAGYLGYSSLLKKVDLYVIHEKDER